MKKAFTILMVFICCLSLTISVLAIEQVVSTNNVSLQNHSVIEVINKYRTHKEIDYEIGRQKKLLSFNGTPDYTIYELIPYGYAIILNSTNGLLEACYAEGASSFVDFNCDNPYYYGGPGVYCVKENNAFLNIYNGTILTDELVDLAIAAEANIQTYETQKALLLASREKTHSTMATSTMASTRTVYVAHSYFSNLTNYGENEDGTCTVISTAMLLGYYDNYANESFVESSFEQGTGTSEAFHQHLNSYVYGNSAPGGIYIRNATAGINRYLSDRNLNCVLRSEHSSQNSAIEQVIDRLEAGEPVIASMATLFNAPYNHTVLVYGVTYDTLAATDTAVFTMNMGWDNNHVPDTEIADGQHTAEYVASAGWFYECGYIDSTCSTHSMSSWINMNSTYHSRHCEFCNYTEKGSHADAWNTLQKVCMLCGRTGFYSIPST